MTVGVSLRVARGLWVRAYLPNHQPAKCRCPVHRHVLLHVLYWVIVGSLILHFIFPITVYLAWRYWRRRRKIATDVPAYLQPRPCPSTQGFHRLGCSFPSMVFCGWDSSPGARVPIWRCTSCHISYTDVGGTIYREEWK